MADELLQSGLPGGWAPCATRASGQKGWAWNGRARALAVPPFGGVWGNILHLWWGRVSWALLSVTDNGEGRMEKILVSACLLGQRDGGAHGPFAVLAQWQAQGRVLPLCPEVAGGLQRHDRQPRLSVVRAGRCWMAGFRCAASRMLMSVRPLLPVRKRRHAGAPARHPHCRVLKARSPSCSNLHSYDGSFSATLVAGEALPRAALRRLGLLVFNETQLAEPSKRCRR